MHIKQCLILLFSCGLAACASGNTGTSATGYEGAANRSDCIFGGTIRDYRVLNESNLIVTAGASRKYHMELTRPARGLKNSWSIAFSPERSSLCAGFGEMIVDDHLGYERYRIRAIRQLTEDDLEDLLIFYGHKEPEIEQAREPEDVKGAEVEELD